MRQKTIPTPIALAAKQAERLGLTQENLALTLGASQSQISRVLSGKTSSTSKLAIALCKYVSQAVQGVNRESISSNDDLMDAVASVWDGTPGHAKALAAIIRSLGLLNPPTRSKA